MGRRPARMAAARLGRARPHTRLATRGGGGAMAAATTKTKGKGCGRGGGGGGSGSGKRTAKTTPEEKGKKNPTNSFISEKIKQLVDYNK